MDEPVLSMVKVPCDPAQVVVNHVSFRVQLPGPSPVSGAVGAFARVGRVPVAAAGRRRPVVWTGRSAPGDPGAGALVQAVRGAGADRADIATATQVLPRVRPIVAPRAPIAPELTRPLPAVPPARGASDGAVPAPAGATGGDPADTASLDAVPAAAPRRAADSRRTAYAPGRRTSRMSLGVVLLPLRVLLGFIAIYAGMGKLTDPVYFDGGARGSLYTWLDSLQPWTVAEPLHAWALAHPIGAGLSVAFLQIIVGVLTVFGLWQRFAAALGAALSLALLVTVSWRNGPAYDTPDIILCAAWSPLIIAGAPVYSLDSRLATEAWRTLGPRAPLGDLRRRVLRRGTLLATLLIGLALLIGSMLGSAVRSAAFPEVPEPGSPPRNHLPGQPLPGTEEETGGRDGASSGPSAGAGAEDGTEEEAAGETGEAEGSEASVSTGPTAGAGASEEAAEDAGQQAPPVEQTVPAPEQTAPPADTGTPEEPAGSQEPDGAGDAGEQDAPAEDGGEQSSLGPIGGLLG
ncbi:DoxX family membrane protein [Streptomyces sp. RFCAC02]|uniref:DoxX family membrane protein n=1 Tax=Streptomyces sp. RFCAC02 TaxID=2499143 RepID=UPI001F11497D|nr:DoxX family membrane protein [Streptomyces sp. RFCAC02]